MLARDVLDLESYVSGHPNVAAASAARHNRQHNLGSTLDHGDVDSTAPTDGQVYAFVSGLWRPVTFVVDGGTY